ncbi:MAG TPA: hypothetical protein VK014_02625 [Cyclobacteriaceae bacterium]|nr:hypothetical protein [Cyclobacteriaceae bacterium]
MKSTVKKKKNFLKVITTSIQSLPAKVAASLLAITAFAGACSDPSEIILDPDNNQIGVFYQEIPLSASMVLLDSFSTTGSGYLVVGGDVSGFFGTTEAIAYSRLSFNPGGKAPTEEAIFDSAKFHLNIASVSGTGLSQAKTFTVHRLQEQILDTTYYNFSSLPFEDDAIASGSFVLKADTINAVSMDLKEELALDLFNKLKASDPVFDNLFAFRNYFPGIAIAAAPEQQVTASISPGSGTGISLYYHYEDDTVSTAYPINTIQSRYFNQINNSRSETPIAAITDKGVAYELDGNLIGSKAGVGLVVKIDTKPIEDFLDTLENVTFNQFSLEMGPLENFPETKQPIKNLVMYFTDDSNKLLRREDGRLLAIQAESQAQIESKDETGKVTPAVGNPSSLVFNTEKFTYSQHLNAYINAVFRHGLERTDLILYPTAPNGSSDEFKNSVKEYIVNKNTIKLKIYYSKIK